MILVSKTAAGPPQHRQAHILQRVDHIAAHTVHIGNGRILAYIEAFINASAQVLAEITIDIFIDVAQLLIGIDQILFHNDLLYM